MQRDAKVAPWLQFVTNGILQIQFMTPFLPEHPYLRQCLYTCCEWH